MKYKEQEMNLIKIGGAVLKNRNGFKRLVDILGNYSGKPLIIVVSALHSTTRDLGKAARLAEQGNEEEANEILNTIIDKHIDFSKELLKDKHTYESLKLLFINSKEKIQDYFKGLAITGELTLRTLDMVLSFGEYFALHTVKHFLKEKGFNIKSIDSTSIIVSDDNYGKAKPLLNQTAKKIRETLLPLMNDNNFVITQGFVAKNQSNEITTMGIESSNLTASIIAEVLDIKRITFWTDVAGIHSGDPKFINKTKPIKQMSYSEAYQASVNGLKLLYPEMIEHIRKSNIEVIYHSASEPKGDYTIVNSDITNSNKFVLVQENMIFCEKEFNSISEKLSLINNLALNKEIFDKINYKIIKQETTVLVFTNKNKQVINFLKKQGISIFKDCNIITLLNINQNESIKIIADIQEQFPINIFSTSISQDTSSIVISSENELSHVINYIHKRVIENSEF